MLLTAKGRDVERGDFNLFKVYSCFCLGRLSVTRVRFEHGTSIAQIQSNVITLVSSVFTSIQQVQSYDSDALNC
jgi:hypothetical protein